MKILYLPSGPLPSTAANAVNVAHMADAFHAMGLEIMLAVPWPHVTAHPSGAQLCDQYGLRAVPSITHVWKPRLRGGGMVHRFLLAYTVRRTGAELVYGRTLQGCRVAAELAKPTVYEAHKPDWAGQSGHGAADFKRLIQSPGFRGVICISRALNEYLLEAYPELHGRTAVVPDGAPDWPLPDELAPSSPWIVGYFGSLYPGKGIETILEVAPHCQWTQFKIVGGTPAEVAWWQKERAVPPNVFFLGRRDHAELPALMQECRAFVAPYLQSVQVHGGGGDVARWMSPLKIFEYMAMNRPLIASDLPVLREVLKHNDNALLARADDTHGWVAALERLRDEQELAQRLARQAHSDYEENYTWDTRARRVLEALESMRAIGQWR